MTDEPKNAKNPGRKTRLAIYLVAGIMMLFGVLGGMSLEPLNAAQQTVQHTRLCFIVLTSYCGARMIDEIFVGRR